MARVRLLTASTARGDASELLLQLENRGSSLALIGAVSNSTGGARSFARLGSALIRHTKLDSLVRELVVLRLAVTTNTPYEWFEHESLARSLGATDEILAMLREEAPSLDSLGERQRLAIAFADCVVKRIVSDHDWARLQHYFDDEELTDLVITAAWWGAMVPAIVDALGVEPPSTGGGINPDTLGPSASKTDA